MGKTSRQKGVGGKGGENLARDGREHRASNGPWYLRLKKVPAVTLGTIQGHNDTGLTLCACVNNIRVLFS